MKKVLALLLALSLVFSCAACGAKGTETATSTGGEGGAVTDTGEQGGTEKGKQEKIKIGVSIWSSTDTLGSQCKMILDAAAKALGVELVYVDQNHISEKVTASMETLAAAGCDGVIICNSSSAEMTSVINTANENKIYVAQFFRSINKESNPNEYQLAVSSPYYVGTVHEDEVDNGYKLAQVLAEKGYRKIALMGWEPGDATFLARWEGYKKGVEGWNKEHPNDLVELLEPQYGGTTSDTGRATAEAILSSNPDADALIAAGGGGDPLIGAIQAIEGLGKTGQIGVASTDFLHDLDVQLQKGAITVESGGHFADPLFAFMMVYNAVRGKYEVPTDGFYEIVFPYIFVSSSEDYANFQKYFIDELPYNEEEMKAMADYSFDQLKETAAKLSIEEVMQRHSGK